MQRGARLVASSVRASRHFRRLASPKNPINDRHQFSTGHLKAIKPTLSREEGAKAEAGMASGKAQYMSDVWKDGIFGEVPRLDFLGRTSNLTHWM